MFILDSEGNRIISLSEWKQKYKEPEGENTCFSGVNGHILSGFDSRYQILSEAERVTVHARKWLEYRAVATKSHGRSRTNSLKEAENN